MPDIFINPEELTNAAKRIQREAEDAMNRIAGLTPKATDSRFTAVQDSVKGLSNAAGQSLGARADTTTRAAHGFTTTDSASARPMQVASRALGGLVPADRSGGGAPSLPPAIRDAPQAVQSAVAKWGGGPSTMAPTHIGQSVMQGFDPVVASQGTPEQQAAQQQAVRQHMATQAQSGGYQAPQVQAVQAPVASPMTQYNSGMMPTQELTPQLSAQTQSAGSQQPSDMVHLNPQQVKILSEYLASQVASGGSSDGAAGGKEVGEIDLSKANGDFQENILTVCEEVINANIPYAWGGGTLEGPSQGISDGGGYADACGDYNKIGFDCSGFTRYVIYQTTGIEIPRVSQAQVEFCIPVDVPEIGDLGFPPGGSPGHVVVAVDGGIAEAQQSGTNVMFSDMPADYVWGRVPGGPNDV